MPPRGVPRDSPSTAREFSRPDRRKSSTCRPRAYLTDGRQPSRGLFCLTASTTFLGHNVAGACQPRAERARLACVLEGISPGSAGVLARISCAKTAPPMRAGTPALPGAFPACWTHSWHWKRQCPAVAIPSSPGLSHNACPTYSAESPAADLPLVSESSLLDETTFRRGNAPPYLQPRPTAWDPNRKTTRGLKARSSRTPPR